MLDLPWRMATANDSRHFAELFDLLEGVLAWVKDGQGRYLWVNRTFLVHYALEHPGESEASVPSRILGRTDYDLSPAFLADQFRLDDEQVLAGHRVIHRIERVGESQGTTVWNVTNKIPVFDKKGRIIGTAGFTRTLRRDELPDGTASSLEPVLACMRDHYQQVITNRQLAAVARMSLRAFERQFLASFHLTPQKYLRKLRLRIASRTLMATNQALSEIALKCGFADQSHFTREFRRQFGRTPREYREHYMTAAGVPVTKTAARKQ
jgi:AraC-like DNA-binding protein